LIQLGWALAQQGREAEEIAQIRECLAAVKSGGTEVALPWGLALLAEALGNESRAEEALNVLAEALAVASRNGDQIYEAEIYGWFSEGFDSADLKDAKVLLEELSN
jgi:hypothetical protein